MSSLRALLACGILAGLLLCTAAAASVQYQNPVVKASAPDPGVLYFKGTYYVATTSNDEPNRFPIRSTPNLVNYTFEDYAWQNASVSPSWTVSDYWAPEIHFIGGRFVFLYAARDTTGVLCIGIAFSQSPTGPWADLGRPLVRDPTVGSIDATAFAVQQSGKTVWYLYWKEDGNGANPPRPTPIWAQQLSDDATSLVGQRTQVLTNTLAWEAPLVEGPWMIQRHGCHLGPFEKRGFPILHSNSAFSGPGHCSVVSIDDNKEDFVMVYHSWLAGHIFGPNDVRVMLVDRVHWTDDGWPFIKTDSPSTTPQTLPTL